MTRDDPPPCLRRPSRGARAALRDARVATGVLALSAWMVTEVAAAAPLQRGASATTKSLPDRVLTAEDLGSGSPLNQLRESDAALASLLRKRVPTWSPEASLAQDRLRRLLASLLDYEKMAERVMGPAWQTMDTAQRKTFVDVFAVLTNQAFVSAASRPSGRVRYLSETVRGSEARVSAAPDHPATEKAVERIEYHLSRSEDRWLIYDVVVDGVSLTESYSDQLQSVLRRDGFDELIARMRRRIDSRSRE